MKTSNRLWRTVMIAFFSTGLCVSAAFAWGGSSSGAQPLYGDWPAVNVNASNLNVSPDTQLNPSNIANIVNMDPNNNLGMIRFDSSLVSLPGVDSTPVVADGNVYYTTGGGSVIAYTTSGTFLWKTDLTDENGVRDFFDSSPILTKDYVFAGGRMMHKLRRSDGVELAKHIYNDDPSITSHIPAGMVQASQLMIAGDKVIYSVSFSDEANGGQAVIDTLYPYSHGEIIAFNQNDLSIAWHIDLTKIGPDGKPTNTSYGAGVTSFGGGAVDTARHLFFIGTGNQYSVQPTDPNGPLPNVSPVSDSLLAINYDTGQIVWFYQYLNHDTYGGGGTDTQVLDGKHDMDVHAHPQLFSDQLIPGFSFTSIDLVGARGKDGTYRIFTRDQIPGYVVPIAQIQADPGTTADGGIQFDPVVKSGLLYLGSTAWVQAATDPFPGVVPGVHASIDFLSKFAGGNPFAAIPLATTTFRALDIHKLVLYGIGQILQGNLTTPVCVIPSKMMLPNTTLTGAPSCTGLLPSNIVKWTTPIKPLFPIASSGMTYDNGVLVVGSVQGVVHLINTNGGAEIMTSNVLIPAPSDKLVSLGYMAQPVADLYKSFGILGLPVLGGISAVNGKLFMPLGIAFPGDETQPVAGVGGIAIYKLP